MSRAARLFSLAQYLHTRGGRTLDEIEEHFSVSARTVFRDLASLEENGVPIAFEESRYRVLDSRSPLMSFDSGEVALLRVALANPALRSGGPLGRRLMALIDKLELALRGTRDGEDKKKAGAPGSPPAATLAMAELERLASKRRPATIHYRSLGAERPSDRGVDPWKIFHRAGSWYLVGRCHLHDEPRLFRLDRIHGVRPKKGDFRVPADFDLERFLADAWSAYVGPERHEVRLRFEPGVAAAVEEIDHHPEESKERQADGSLDYAITVSSLEEIARWVVGFGGACQVLGPTELKARVRQLASGVLATEWRGPANGRRKR